jgi:peptidyl-prolyl cis-trans isomerase SurA
LQPDEISEIFETEFGYHIVQLVDRRGNEIDVRHILMTPKISNQDMLDAKAFLQALKNDIIDQTMDFSEAASEFSSDKDTKFNGGLLINPNTNNSFFSISELESVDASLLNEIESLSIGSITDPMYIKLPSGKESYLIIKLVSKKNEHIANLIDDYPYLKNYFSNIKQERILNEWYKDKVKHVHISSSELLNYEFYNKLYK